MAIGKPVVPSEMPQPKRKAYLLPAFGDFHKPVLASLCAELGIPSTGRKSELVDRLYEADNAAAFGHQSEWSTFGVEQLLTLCIKARVRFIREGHHGEPNFTGLSKDLEFLKCCTCSSSSTRRVAVNAAFDPKEQ